jgi:hypothetical protein
MKDFDDLVIFLICMFGLWFLVLFVVSDSAQGACVMSYCKERSAVTSPAPGSRQVITNNRRQRVGDVYNPGAGRRIQIRDADRRIIGYIEPNGRITDTRRQRIGEVNR